MKTSRTKKVRQTKSTSKPSDFKESTFQFLAATEGPLWVNLAVCMAVFLTATCPLWLLEAVPIWDADMQYLPFYSALSDFSRAGQRMYWSPWTSLGTPMFVMPGAGVFSPLVQGLSFVFGPGLEGFRLYWLTLWTIGWSGMLLLARHFNAPNWIAIVVALGFGFSGVMTGHAEHTDFIFGNALLPWLIFFLDKTLLRPSLGPASSAGLFLGFILGASYPGVGFGASLLVCFWILARSVSLWKMPLPEGGKRNRYYYLALLGCLSLTAVLGLCIACPAFVGFLRETIGYTVRSGTLDKQTILGSNPLTLSAVFTLFSPYLSNLTLLGSKAFSPTDVSSISIYLGLVPLTFLLISFRVLPRAAFRNWLVGGALFFFLLACSTEVPLRSWMYDLFPPTRFFRHSSLFRIYSVFLLLSAVLVNAKEIHSYFMAKQSKPDLPLARVLFVWAVLACAGYLYVLKGFEFLPPHLFWAMGHDSLGWLLLTGALLALGLKKLTAKNTVLLLTGVAIVDALFTTFLAQPTMWTYSDELQEHWNALTVSRRSSLDLKQMTGLKRWPGNGRNDGLITKVPELNNYIPLKNPFYEKLATERHLSPIALGPDRIWFAPSANFAAATDASHERYSDVVKESGKFALLIHNTEANFERPSDDSFLTPLHYRLTQYTPNRMALQLDLAKDGWVLVSDRWSRSWIATVDNASVPIELGNFLFRAVKVPAGKHMLEFEYVVDWLKPFIYLSHAAMLLALLGAGWGAWLTFAKKSLKPQRAH